MTNINKKDKLPQAELLKIFTTPVGNNIIAYKIPRVGGIKLENKIQEDTEDKLFLETAQNRAKNFNKTWITLFVQTATTNYLATTYEKGKILAKVSEMFEALVISTDQLDKFHFPLDYALESLDYLGKLIEKRTTNFRGDPSNWISFANSLKKVVALDENSEEEDKDSIIYKKAAGIEAVLSAEEIPILVDIDFEMFGGSHLLQKESAKNFAQTFFDYLLTLLELYPEEQKGLFECVPSIKAAIAEKYGNSNQDDFPF